MIIKRVLRDKCYSGQISFLKVEKKIEPSWFGMVIIINKKFVNKKREYLDYLHKKGIETRPIISGNFINQPAIKLYGLNKKKYNFKNAQMIENQGFFIGLHTQKMSIKLVEYVAKNLLKINEIEKNRFNRFNGVLGQFLKKNLKVINLILLRVI